MSPSSTATARRPSGGCLVLMGVSACGKSVVGRAVAERLAGSFVDGDDHHPASNVAKMAAGTPLDEADRLPWLDALHALIRAHHVEARLPLIVACSALARTYRDRLRGAMPRGAVRFVHLAVDFPEALDRIEARRDHFMKGRHMLEDQFRRLEPLAEDELAMGSVVIDASGHVAGIVESVLAVA